jgi:DNA uptake protein ComE-like DNA-binding protein
MGMWLTPLKPRYVALYGLCMFALLMWLRPSNDRESDIGESDQAYLSACEGSRLRTVERREQAQMDGYEINRVYDCIDKTSFAQVGEQRAKWEAANTPEAIAKQKAEREKLIARDREQRTAEEEKRRTTESMAAAAPVREIVPADVNTATAAELEGIASISASVAAQIIEERRKRPFRDWDDLVSRVVGLSAAQTAVFASISGLTVNGESLLGAEPNAEMAARLRQRYSSH